MDKIAILFAKFAGLQKNFKEINWGSLGRASGQMLDPLIKQYVKCRNELMEIFPELFSDLPIMNIPEPIGMSGSGDKLYTYHQITPIIQNINYIIEVRTNYRIGEKVENEERP